MQREGLRILPVLGSDKLLAVKALSCFPQATSGSMDIFKLLQKRPENPGQVGADSLAQCPDQFLPGSAPQQDPLFLERDAVQSPS